MLAGLLAPRTAGPARAAQRLDSDQDGLFDDDEVNVYGTKLDVFDTDGDGSSDGEEVYLGTDPLTANDAVQRADRDGDGLFDDDEANVYGTNPDTSDTDGDDRPDGQEVADGTDPLVKNISASGGSQPPPADDGESEQPDEDGEAPPPGTGMFLREICVPGVDVCATPLQCGTPTTRHTCSGTVAGVSAWCCVPPGGSCTECDCCGDFYCEFDDNNVATCQPNPEG